MGWVRQAPAALEHVCAPPMRDAIWAFPSHSLTGHGETVEHTEQVVDGWVGDLWRCECRRLWRIGQPCDACDRHGQPGSFCPRGGAHAVSLAWRPARWWQRLLHITG